MVGRRAVLVVGAGAVGFVAGRWSTPEVLAPVVEDEVASPPERPARVEPAPCEGEVSALEEEVAALEAKLALAEKLRADLEVTLYGTPPRWADEVPEELLGEAFERRVREVLAACAPDAEWLGLDCEEPPCFGLARITSDEVRTVLEEDCPAWRAGFEEPPLAWRFRTACVDGAEEELVLALGARDALPWLVGEDGEPARIKTRFRHRSARLRDGWTCLAVE